MGLFSRRQKSEEDRGEAAPQPVDPAGIDLGAARSVVTDLVQAVGSSPRMRVAVGRLRDASGMPDPDNAFATMAAFQQDRFLTTRLWRWLLAAATKANQEGEADVAAMAAFWAWGWNATVVPNMTGADALELGFDKPPEDVLAGILEQGALAASRLDDDFVVARTAEPETVTVALLRVVLPDAVAAPPPAAPVPVEEAVEPPAAPEPPAPPPPLPADVERGDQLARDGDLGAARAAYERAEDAGEILGTLRLAALLEDRFEDPVAAEAAWRRADEAGDLNGSGNLGRLLRESGDKAGAEAAFRRCVNRGSVRARADWAGLLYQRDGVSGGEIAEAMALLCDAHDLFIWHRDMSTMGAVMILDSIVETCDPAAVEAGARRADEQGSASGAWNLAWALRDRGQLPEAVAAFRRAGERGYGEAWVKGAGACLEMGDQNAAEQMAREGERAGEASASTALGAILDEQGRGDEALAAYRRGDAGGDGFGAYNLGVELANRGDLRGAEEALLRAVERKADNAEEALATVRRLSGSR